MAAPKNPNPGPGAKARRGIGDQTAALRLTKAGWTCIPPNTTVDVPLLCGGCGAHLSAGGSLTTAIKAISSHNCQGRTA